MKVPPYVSITDFVRPREVELMCEVFEASGGRAIGRKLGIGAMMSYKTLKRFPSRWVTVFPPKESLPSIFGSSHQCFNVLHYADYENVDVLASLPAAVLFGGDHLHALQPATVIVSVAGVRSCQHDIEEGWAQVGKADEWVVKFRCPVLLL